MAHFLKVIFYFFLSTLLTLTIGLGAHYTPGVLAWGAFGTMLVGLISVFGGLILTIGIRHFFKLSQTGRIIQYASFWSSGWLGLWLIAKWTTTGIVLTNAPLAAFVAFAVCFTAATLNGEIPWKGRSWLPKKGGGGGHRK
jgi:hypothetical protein